MGHAPAMCAQSVWTWDLGTQRTLAFPEDVTLSDPAKDLIRAWLTDAPARLGSTGVDAIKRHPWFANVSWSSLRNGALALLARPRR